MSQSSREAGTGMSQSSREAGTGMNQSSREAGTGMSQSSREAGTGMSQGDSVAYSSHVSVVQQLGQKRQFPPQMHSKIIIVSAMITAVLSLSVCKTI